MPIARFQMPDGRIARFEVPAGTTSEQANSMFNSFLAQQGQQEEPRRDVGIIESGVAGLKKLLSSQRTALETPFGAEEAAQRGAARARALEAETPSQLSLEAVKKKYAEEGLFPAAGAGVNDLGGTLMIESISTAAGSRHGQLLTPA